MELAVAVSCPAEEDGFLRMIEIRSAHWLWRGSKAINPMP
jgi:hypothetical protein